MVVSPALRVTWKMVEVPPWTPVLVWTACEASRYATELASEEVLPTRSHDDTAGLDRTDLLEWSRHGESSGHADH